jgi:hypothetical protein
MSPVSQGDQEEVTQTLGVGGHIASGTYAAAEHVHQFLTRMLSISVKIPNLKMPLQTRVSDPH